MVRRASRDEPCRLTKGFGLCKSGGDQRPIRGNAPNGCATRHADAVTRQSTGATDSHTGSRERGFANCATATPASVSAAPASFTPV